jgi:hypothetical protein
MPPGSPVLQRERGDENISRWNGTVASDPSYYWLAKNEQISTDMIF